MASFQAPPEPPFELVNARHTVSFRYLAESNTLALVLAGGDIVVISLEDELLPSQDRVRRDPFEGSKYMMSGSSTFA